MKSWFTLTLGLLIVMLLALTEVRSQTPTIQDCPGAIAICNSSYNYASSFTGEGNFPDEVSTSSCMGTSEKNTVWFTFTAQATGDVGFLISPNSGSSTDYDWAVYDVTGVGCSGSTISQSLMVSCNYSSTATSTGPNGGSSSTSQGASGTTYNDYINATTGNNYVIVIDNFSGNSTGFTVNFGSSPTSIIDATPPQILSVTTPTCGATTLAFNFSEAVLCNTVQTSDFTLTGPGGPYTITNVTSSLCSSGGSQAINFTATVSPAITSSGNYSLNLTGAVTDLCSNTAPSDVLAFTVTNPANATITAVPSPCANGAAVSLSAATAGGTWSGNGVSGTSFNPATAGAGTHTISYSVTVGGCTDTDTEQIIVTSVPDGTITDPGSVCTGSAPISLNAATGGGTWSGTGVSGSTFNPATSGAGTFTINYTVTSSGCTGTDTEDVIVGAGADATITALSTLCANGSSVALSAATGGGNWAGTGVSGTNFDPAVSGAGTFTITYTISGSCGASDTESIIVNPTPDATITSPGTLCTTGSSVTLSSATGGGTWSGTGVSGSSFNPSLSGAGTFTVAYNVTSGGCSSSDTEQIIVVSSPDATITSPGALCTSDAPVTLAAASGGGTWTGTAVSGGVFDPATAGQGTYTITYDINAGSCSTSDTETIIVTSTPDATILPLSTLCSAGTPITLSAASSGGTWSGNGITGNSFNPTTAGAGTHIISYSVANGGCSDSDTLTVIVETTPNATINAISNQCTGNPAVNLTAASLGGTWSGTGVTGTTFDPASSGAGTVTVTYSVSSTNCSSSDTESIIVNLTPDATIAPPGTKCTADASFTLNAATAGGTWSGTGVSGSTFSPSVSGNGTFTVTYTVTANGCSNTDTEDVYVVTNPDATISALGAVCTADADITLSAITPGGTWLGTAVTGTSFSPSTAGAGNYTITYAINSGTCSASDTETITVNQSPDATITPVASLCTGSSTANLNAATSGGTWSGTGVSGSTFSPSISGQGTFTISYTVTSGGCTSSDTESIIVSTTADATINPLSSLCSDGAAATLSAVTPGGTWTGTAVSGTSFNPASSGAGTYTVTYTISGACGSSDTENIIVNQTPDATISSVTTKCLSDAAFALTAVSTGGSWSGQGVSGSNFDPAVAGNGTHVITYSVTTGGCSDSDTEQIIVTDDADATIVNPGSLCTGGTVVNLTALTGGGIWSGTGVTGTSFNPATAGAGTHTISYAISGSCGDSDTEQIIVGQTANTDIPVVGPYCTSSAAVDLEPSVGGGGNWTGSGITNTTNGTFNPATAGAGTHNVSYTVSGLCGGSDVQPIVVVAQANATINPTTSLCTNTTSITLTAATPGGTWTGTGVTNPSAGTFNPSTAGAGTFTVTYSIGGTCGDSDTYDVVVNAAADATINPAGPFCANNGPVTLTGITPGGIWQGTGIQNPNAGSFDPSLAGVGTHAITYAINGVCPSSDSELLVVNAIPNTPTGLPVVTCAENIYPLVVSSNGQDINWYSDVNGTNPIALDTAAYLPSLPPGTYDTTFTFYIQAANGPCVSSMVAITYNISKVSAFFVPSPDSGKVDLVVTFNNLSQGVDSTDSFAWDFGDEHYSGEISPVYTYDEAGEFIVTLVVTNQSGCTSVFVDTIKTIAVGEIDLPNVFSPNGDGMNDAFNLNGKHLYDIHAKIFNRWGQLVYEWNTEDGGWDGRNLTGKDAPVGTYYYTIKAMGKDEKEEEVPYEFNGTLMLVR